MSSEYHYFITNDVCEQADISWDAMVALMLTLDDIGTKEPLDQPCNQIKR